MKRWLLGLLILGFVYAAFALEAAWTKPLAAMAQHTETQMVRRAITWIADYQQQPNRPLFHRRAAGRLFSFLWSTRSAHEREVIRVYLNLRGMKPTTLVR